MSGGKIKVLSILSLILLFLFSGTLFAQHKSSFCCLWGEVDYRGAPAEDGYEVTAYIDDNLVAQTTTEDGEYSLCIPKDDPDTQKKDGWSEDDIIVLKVNGQKATPPIKAFSGTIRQKITVSSLNVKLTTWGKIKALFK